MQEKINRYSTGANAGKKSRLMQKNLENLLGVECEKCDSAILKLQKFPDLSADDKGNKRGQISDFCKQINCNHEKRNYEYQRLCVLPEPPAGMGVSFKLRSGGRLLVNHAGGLLENSNLYLHRLFGFPIIPGSALKGVARAYAEQNSPDLRMINRVFGTAKGVKNDAAGDILEEQQKSDHRGDIVFMPAYPAGKWKLDADVLTSHTGGDTQNPVPVFFPAVKPGATFKFQLRKISSSVPDEEINAAREWLTGALTTAGVGAKTSAGYGWFEEVQE